MVLSTALAESASAKLRRAPDRSNLRVLIAIVTSSILPVWQASDPLPILAVLSVAFRLLVRTGVLTSWLPRLDTRSRKMRIATIRHGWTIS